MITPDHSQTACPTVDELRKLLFRDDPYRGFDPQGLSVDLQGWGSERAMFAELLAELRPRFIIEVGTWKGASAIHMARCAQELALDTHILCVDTWLGSVEHWVALDEPERGDWYDSLNLRNGYPALYYQFLHNVVASGYSSKITPFPNSSCNAARWLKRKELKADLIYIDGSHHSIDVTLDLLHYYRLLHDNGILLGDDYEWVKDDVENFGKHFSVPVAVLEEGTAWAIPKMPGVTPPLQIRL